MFAMFAMVFSLTLVSMICMYLLGLLDAAMTT